MIKNVMHIFKNLRCFICTNTMVKKIVSTGDILQFPYKNIPPGPNTMNNFFPWLQPGPNYYSRVLVVKWVNLIIIWLCLRSKWFLLQNKNIYCQITVCVFRYNIINGVQYYKQFFSCATNIYNYGQLITPGIWLWTHIV